MPKYAKLDCRINTNIWTASKWVARRKDAQDWRDQHASDLFLEPKIVSNNGPKSIPKKSTRHHKSVPDASQWYVLGDHSVSQKLVKLDTAALSRRMWYQTAFRKVFAFSRKLILNHFLSFPVVRWEAKTIPMNKIINLKTVMFLLWYCISVFLIMHTHSWQKLWFSLSEIDVHLKACRDSVSPRFASHLGNQNRFQSGIETIWKGSQFQTSILTRGTTPAGCGGHPKT